MANRMKKRTTWVLDPVLVAETLAANGYLADIPMDTDEWDLRVGVALTSSNKQVVVISNIAEEDINDGRFS